MATWNVEFDAGGGSFVLYNGTATDDTTLDSDTPPPIWTGSTASPTFTLGSYVFNEVTDSKTASGGTLLITNVNASDRSPPPSLCSAQLSSPLWLLPGPVVGRNPVHRRKESHRWCRFGAYQIAALGKTECTRLLTFWSDSRRKPVS